MINTQKIIAGISKFNKKKKMKITGSTIFDYIAKSKISVSDEILNKIEDNKTLKNQPPIVLEFLSKHFVNVEVKNVTNKQKVVDTVQNVHKKNHIALSSISPKSIALTVYLLNEKSLKRLDLNIFKKPIDEFTEDLHWKKILDVITFNVKGSDNENPTQKT